MAENSAERSEGTGRAVQWRRAAGDEHSDCWASGMREVDVVHAIRVQAAKRGEKSAIFTFDETRQSFKVRSRGMGMELDRIWRRT